MEIIVVLLSICFACSFFACIALLIGAYSKRKDRSFFGGADFFNGWFLLFPYGKNGVSREEHRLVFWCRATAVMALGFVAMACWLRPV